MVRFTTCFVCQPDMTNFQLIVDRFQHIIKLECCDRYGCKRLHLYAGTADRVGRYREQDPSTQLRYPGKKIWMGACMDIFNINMHRINIDRMAVGKYLWACLCPQKCCCPGNIQ